MKKITSLKIFNISTYLPRTFIKMKCSLLILYMSVKTTSWMVWFKIHSVRYLAVSIPDILSLILAKLNFSEIVFLSGHLAARILPSLPPTTAKIFLNNKRKHTMEQSHLFIVSRSLRMRKNWFDWIERENLIIIFILWFETQYSTFQIGLK